jgi:hypothetical protein
MNITSSFVASVANFRNIRPKLSNTAHFWPRDAELQSKQETKQGVNRTSHGKAIVPALLFRFHAL